MGMRRTAPTRYVGFLLVAIGWVLLAVAQSDECAYNRELDRLECDPSGTIPGDEPPPTGEPARDPEPPPPVRYLQITAEGCHQWSPDPPGLDTWDISNEAAMSTIILTTPECTSEPDPERGWRIFRSFPLATPTPTFQPANYGITGHPTYLAAGQPATITHSEVLPDGRTFEVRAYVSSLSVDWGDGFSTTDDPAAALPYPTGEVTHTYTTKTCPPDYRITHPSGPNCHPTLEAYPVNATFTWWGEYRAGSGWIPIGTLDLSTTVLYDVDEVVGVLVDP